jgi:hypothetical protein
MAHQVAYPGRLIAIDGSRGKDTLSAAKALAAQLRKAGVDCAISRWDASGLFGELASAAHDDRNISMRSLALIYAADLAFRLRWEIRPALESGSIVIAAPYLETPIAFGASCGLSDAWTRELLRFAPAANVRALAEDHKSDRPWKRRTDRGFPEFCAKMLTASAKHKLPAQARRDMVRMLAQARGRKLFRLTSDGSEAMIKSMTDSRPRGRRRSVTSS